MSTNHGANVGSSPNCPQCGFQLRQGGGGLATSAKLNPPRGVVETWAPVLEAATREVFEVMLGAPLTRRENGRHPPVTELTGMVGLAGYLSGILSVRCSHDSATRIAATMLGTDGPEAKQQLRDALGEICNMVAGSFKSKVAGLDEACVLSVPSVISGADYHLYSLVHGASIFVEFEFDRTPLWVTLDVECD